MALNRITQRWRDQTRQLETVNILFGGRKLTGAQLLRRYYIRRALVAVRDFAWLTLKVAIILVLLDWLGAIV